MRTTLRRPATRLRWLVEASAVAVLGLALLCYLLAIAFPQRHGLLALLPIFLPYLGLLPLVLLPLALWPGARLVRLALLVGGVLWGALFGPGLVAFPAPAPPGALRLSAASWNVLQDNHDLERLLEGIRGANADLIVLHELAEPQQAAIVTDPSLLARYRWRILVPSDRYLGVGLLSAYPMSDAGSREFPPMVWGRVEIGGRSLLVVGAHPLPGQIGWLHVGEQALPISFNSVGRDLQVERVLTAVAALRRPGEPVLLMGDFNLTEREPIYRELTTQFVDAKRVAGPGFQHTWKPWFLLAAPFALLRIDYLFVSPDVQPLTFTTDCRPFGSDHCLVRGEFALGRPAVS